jgi:hypothetical protein
MGWNLCAFKKSIILGAVKQSLYKTGGRISQVTITKINVKLKHFDIAAS